MTDLITLRSKYIAAIANAADEATLEDVRLAALGKKGEISLKMRELGQMAAEDRQTFGAALNVLKDEIDAALRAARAGLADAALNARLQVGMAGCHPARPPAPHGHHPPGQSGDGRTDRDLCRYGLCRRRRPAGRIRLV